MDINSEDLAYWYLRLNGFLSIRNFIVHPDKGSDQGTDVDLLCVRFPFRGENIKRPMPDEKLFAEVAVPYLAFGEITRKMCKINGAWTNPKKQNIERVLHAVGVFPTAENSEISQVLHKNGFFEDDRFRVSIICFGGEVNPEISDGLPLVPQVLWSDCLRFIFTRFRAYKNEKASHPQWDDVGQTLWNQAIAYWKDSEGFVKSFSVN